MSFCSSPSSSIMHCSARVVPSTSSTSIDSSLPEPPRKITKEQAEGTARSFYFATDSTLPAVTAGFNRMDLSGMRVSGSGPGSESCSNNLLLAPKKEKCGKNCAEKPSSARRLFSSPKLTSTNKIDYADKMDVDDIDEGVELETPHENQVAKKLF